MIQHSITPCLWFANDALQAAEFYVSVFKNSSIHSITYYGKEGYEVHGQPEGTVMTVAFTLEGQPFTALNGGPIFTFNESISFQIMCDTQVEIDYFWSKLTSGGGKESQCGWLKDKFGLSWQVTPSILPILLNDPLKAGKVMEAFLPMKKFDIEKLIAAGS